MNARWIGLAAVGLVSCKVADDVQVEPVSEPPSAPAWQCASFGSLATPDSSEFVTAGLPADLTLLDLGVHETTCGFSDSIAFELPVGATSATLVLFGNEGAFTFPGGLTDPAGTEVIGFDPLAPIGLIELNLLGALANVQSSANRVFPRGAKSAVLIPNNDSVDLLPGTWTLDLGSWSAVFDAAGEAVPVGLDSAVHAFVLVRTEPVETATLDVALHFTGSGALTASSAPTTEQVVDALDALDDALEPNGITIGNISYTDLPDGFNTPLELAEGSCLESAASRTLMQTPTPSRPDALNVFFVPDFTCNASGTQPFDLGPALAGIANGLPGVPFSTSEGVFVSTRYMVDTPALWTKVVAHEIAHQLGLFHTTELSGTIFDPIADTPEGPIDNLMFWDPSVFPDGFVLSPEQGRVLRNNPLVRPL